MPQTMTATDYVNEQLRQNAKDNNFFEDEKNIITVSNLDEALALLFYISRIPMCDSGNISILSLKKEIPVYTKAPEIIFKAMVTAMKISTSQPHEFIHRLNHILKKSENMFVHDIKSLFMQCEVRLKIYNKRNITPNLKNSIDNFIELSTNFNKDNKKTEATITTRQNANAIDHFVEVTEAINPETLNEINYLIEVSQAVHGFEKERSHLKELSTAISTYHNTLALDAATLNDLKKYQKNPINLPADMHRRINSSIKLLKSAAKEFFTLAEKQLQHLELNFFQRLWYLFTYVLHLTYLVKTPAYEKQVSDYNRLLNTMTLFQKKGYDNPSALDPPPTPMDKIAALS